MCHPFVSKTFLAVITFSECEENNHVILNTISAATQSIARTMFHSYKGAKSMILGSSLRTVYVATRSEALVLFLVQR